MYTISAKNCNRVKCVSVGRGCLNDMHVMQSTAFNSSKTMDPNALYNN